MKKTLLLLILSIFVAMNVWAGDFAPTLLKLSAEPIIQYDFNGAELQIPLSVSGTAAGVIFLVYTKDQASQIPDTRNGFLGWHHVNKVDTCVYYSALQSYKIGNNTITWEGKNKEGEVVPAGDYTYYMWAYDNMGIKVKMSHFLSPRFTGSNVLEADENGLPLANPIWYQRTERWTVGNDPLDSLLVETTSITIPEGWGSNGDPCIDPHDKNYFYLEVGNSTVSTGGIAKFKWVPNSESEIQTDFGDAGYSDFFTYKAGNNAGVRTNGTYLYTPYCNWNRDEEINNFYIYDYDGTLVDEVDLTAWWTHPDDFAAGGQMNGGPSLMDYRNEKVFFSCHGSCIHQMIDPIRFLDSGDSEDLFVWTNLNGDYILDHNFEETASVPWMCNDYAVGPYMYNIGADANLFSQCPCYDVGALSFGLLAPDGTGLGYFAFAGETAGWKKGSLFIDGNTAYDGLYCDNNQAGGTHYQEGGWQENEYTSGVYFIGHDSITGVITSAVGVDEAAPAAFSVAQNSPNPFNPTTTISLNLVVSGTVSVEIFNIAGQKVATIADRYMSAGSHSVIWDASGFSAGVYFYTVKAGSFSKTMKMTLLK